MLNITDAGRSYLQSLLHKQKEFDTYMEETNKNVPETPKERTRIVRRATSRLNRFRPQLSILWKLNEQGPTKREEFYVPKEQPLQTGWRKQIDTARDRIIDKLIAEGFIEESK